MMMGYVQKALLGVILCGVGYDVHATKLEELRKQNADLVAAISKANREEAGLGNEVYYLEENITRAENERKKVRGWLNSARSAPDKRDDVSTWNGRELTNTAVFDLLEIPEPQTLADFEKLLTDFCVVPPGQTDPAYSAKALEFINKATEVQEKVKRADRVSYFCRAFGSELVWSIKGLNKELLAHILRNPEILGEDALPFSPSEIRSFPFSRVAHVNDRYMPSFLKTLRWSLRKFGKIPSY